MDMHVLCVCVCGSGAHLHMHGYRVQLAWRAPHVNIIHFSTALITHSDSDHTRNTTAQKCKRQQQQQQQQKRTDPRITSFFYNRRQSGSDLALEPANKRWRLCDPNELQHANAMSTAMVSARLGLGAIVRDQYRKMHTAH